MDKKQKISDLGSISDAIMAFERPARPTSKHWCEVKIKIPLVDAEFHKSRLREEGWCFTSYIDGDHVLIGLHAITDAYKIGIYERA